MPVWLGNCLSSLHETEINEHEIQIIILVNQTNTIGQLTHNNFLKCGCPVGDWL